MCLAKGFTWFEGYVKGVRKIRGAAAARRLWDDVKAQHQLGNEGKPGDWRQQRIET